MLNVLSDLYGNKGQGLFIDVGANIGQTLLKLKSIGREIHYLGFEPNASCVQYLYALIKQNEFEFATVFPVGISNESKRLDLNFYTRDLTDESASMVPRFRPANTIHQTVKIQVEAPDELPAELFDNVYVLKVDVEGAELEVLDGFKEIIEKHLPFILVEILPVYNESNRSRLKRQQALVKGLLTLGYNMFRIIKLNSNQIEYARIEDIGIHRDINACDYIFVPKGKKLLRCHLSR